MRSPTCGAGSATERMSCWRSWSVARRSRRARGRRRPSRVERRAAAEQVAAASSEELAAVETELAAGEAERPPLAATIDPDTLELYEELRPQKKGVGAAALVDNVCQGCHEQLSSVELDHARHADGIVRCDHCRRILVL